MTTSWAVQEDTRRADVRGLTLGNRVPVIVPGQADIHAVIDADRTGTKVKVNEDRTTRWASAIVNMASPVASVVVLF